MSMKRLVRLFILLLAVSATSVSGSESRGHAEQEKYLLDVRLANGLSVQDAVYRKERLGGKALLQIRKKFGLSISSQEGSSHPSLSEVEFQELISELLVRIHQDHQDQLDSIQLEITLVDSLWSDAVKSLREAAIPPDYRVTPKSDHVLRAMQTYLSSTPLVRSVCEKISAIGKKCKKHAVSMNPMPFRSEYVGKEWREVRSVPDAGILKDDIWFAIDIESL